jgi:RimJ/RimL family protein N-acetyltransferase
VTHDAQDLRPGRAIARDELRVRRLRPADRPFVEAVGRGLSAESLRLRFGRPSLPPERHLGWIHELDGPQHVAYGVSEARTGRPIALARYVLDVDRPGEADIAVAVIDEWQGRGVGRIALAALHAHGRGVGVTVARALVRSDNPRALALAHSLGARRVQASHGTVEFVVEVAAPGLAEAA